MEELKISPLAPILPRSRPHLLLLPPPTLPSATQRWGNTIPLPAKPHIPLHLGMRLHGGLWMLCRDTGPMIRRVPSRPERFRARGWGSARALGQHVRPRGLCPTCRDGAVTGTGETRAGRCPGACGDRHRTGHGETSRPLEPG